MLYKTKTFAEYQHYVRPDGVEQWERVATGVAPDGGPIVSPRLDDQINGWVQQTGNEIVNPGQITIVREYVKYQDAVRLTVTLATIVLYLSPGQDTHDSAPAASDS